MSSRALKVLFAVCAVALVVPAQQPPPASLEAWAKGFMKAPQWLELVYHGLEKR